MKSINEKENRKDDQATCGRCGQLIDGYPALSRKDNKTEICSDCGVYEALEVALKFHNW